MGATISIEVAWQLHLIGHASLIPFLTLLLPPLFLPARFTGIRTHDRPSIVVRSVVLCALVRCWAVILDVQTRMGGGVGIVCEANGAVTTVLFTALISHLPALVQNSRFSLKHRSTVSPTSSTPQSPRQRRASYSLLAALYLYALLTLIPSLLPISFGPPRLLTASEAAAAVGSVDRMTGSGTWWGVSCRPDYDWWRYVRFFTLISPLLLALILASFLGAALFARSAHPDPRARTRGIEWAGLAGYTVLALGGGCYVVAEQWVGWDGNWAGRAAETLIPLLVFLSVGIRRSVWSPYTAWLRGKKPATPEPMYDDTLHLDQVSSSSSSSWDIVRLHDRKASSSNSTGDTKSPFNSTDKYGFIRGFDNGPHRNSHAPSTTSSFAALLPPVSPGHAGHAGHAARRDTVMGVNAAGVGSGAGIMNPLGRAGRMGLRGHVQGQGTGASGTGHVRTASGKLIKQSGYVNAGGVPSGLSRHGQNQGGTDGPGWKGEGRRSRLAMWMPSLFPGLTLGTTTVPVNALRGGCGRDEEMVMGMGMGREGAGEVEMEWGHSYTSPTSVMNGTQGTAQGQSSAPHSRSAEGRGGPVMAQKRQVNRGLDALLPSLTRHRDVQANDQGRGPDFPSDDPWNDISPRSSLYSNPSTFGPTPIITYPPPSILRERAAPTTARVRQRGVPLPPISMPDSKRSSVTSPPAYPSDPSDPTFPAYPSVISDAFKWTSVVSDTAAASPAYETLGPSAAGIALGVGSEKHGRQSIHPVIENTTTTAATTTNFSSSSPSPPSPTSPTPLPSPSPTSVYASYGSEYRHDASSPGWEDSKFGHDARAAYPRPKGNEEGGRESMISVVSVDSYYSDQRLYPPTAGWVYPTSTRARARASGVISMGRLDVLDEEAEGEGEEIVIGAKSGELEGAVGRGGRSGSGSGGIGSAAGNGREAGTGATGFGGLEVPRRMRDTMRSDRTVDSVLIRGLLKHRGGGVGGVGGGEEGVRDAGKRGGRV